MFPRVTNCVVRPALEQVRLEMKRGDPDLAVFRPVSIAPDGDFTPPSLTGSMWARPELIASIPRV